MLSNRRLKAEKILLSNYADAVTKLLEDKGLTSKTYPLEIKQVLFDKHYLAKCDLYYDCDCICTLSFVYDRGVVICRCDEPTCKDKYTDIFLDKSCTPSYVFNNLLEFLADKGYNLSK